VVNVAQVMAFSAAAIISSLLRCEQAPMTSLRPAQANDRHLANAAPSI